MTSISCFVYSIFDKEDNSVWKQHCSLDWTIWQSQVFLVAYCNVFNVQEENEVYEINSEIKSKAARSHKDCQHGKRLNSL